MRKPELAALVLAPLLGLAAGPALAQYKWVDAGGRTTYSDMPPPPGVVAMKLGEPRPDPQRPDGVPASLAAAASKYPVTLYVTENCVPCQQARAHLERRGVPFAERIVRTVADAEAFRRIGFRENSFPSVSVGRERSVGFEAADWDRILDAAGYPQSSRLPPSYRRPPARALAAAASKPATPIDDAQLDEPGAPAQPRTVNRQSGPELAARATRDGRAVQPAIRF